MKEVSRSPQGMRCPWRSHTYTAMSALQPRTHWAAMWWKRALKSVEDSMLFYLWVRIKLGTEGAV